jgi:twinkle protein
MSDHTCLGHMGCPNCQSQGRDTSGDNLGVFSDGKAWCFSCKYYIHNVERFFGKSLEDLPLQQSSSLFVPRLTLRTLPKETNISTDVIYPRDGTEYQPKDIPEEVLHVVHDVHGPWRGITTQTMSFYGVGLDDKVVSFPYGGDRYKLRALDKKSFLMTGSAEGAQPLFGMDRFQRGQGRSVTLTEGELDAMSAYQMLGSQWACVSVPGAAAAKGACAKARDWLNTFEKIYLCFDADQPGQEAAQEVAKLFDVNKVYHVKLDKHKDANDYLQAKDEKAFVAAWWAAKKFLPKGIVHGAEEIKEILSRQREGATASYPFPTLQSLTYGIRPGEVVLFTAQEKIGKTEILRAIEHHLLETTEDNVGVIHLEEDEKRSVQGIIGYELSTPVHLPDACVSVEDQMVAYNKLTGNGERLYVYSHFGSDDPSVILDRVRALATVCNCRYIFLDHISMIVSGLKDITDERRELDQIATELAKMARDLNFTLFLVSHVNDDGKTRGSRYISKVADILLHLNRDIEAADPQVRNTTEIICRGNRFAGITGPAGRLFFDKKTYKLTELKEEKPVDLNKEAEEWLRGA